jgi:alkylation response protein AidB-like acyl-CoA dehydrogenase
LGSVLGVSGLAALPEVAKQLCADGLVTVLACPADAPPGVGPGAAASPSARPAMTRPLGDRLAGAASPPSARPVMSRPPGARPDVVVGRGRLTGRCPAVLGAATAHRLLVPTTNGLFLVDAGEVGVTRRAVALTDRSRSLADVELDGVRATPVPAPVAEVVAEAGLRAGVLVAADALGVLQRMLDMTVEQVLGRRQFGVAVGSFQAVKHAAAEMLVTLEAARSIVYLAAASVQAGHPDATLHAAAAKAQVCADVAAAADTALTLHGAIGYTWEHDMQIFYKRAKLDATLFGSAAAWNERIAAELPLLPTA